MNSLGLIDSERLELIPPKYWKAHEYCFYLHDQLASMLVEYSTSGAHLQVEDIVQQAFLSAVEQSGEEIDENLEIDLLEFLKNSDLKEPYQQHIIGHVVLALTSDLLHYLYEALTCFEKRKFSVGFSLLRKPLKENLFHLSWLLSDVDGFIKRFEKDNYKTLNGISKDERLRVFNSVIDQLPMSNAFEAELIWDILYSKHLENGFEPTWQKATHLVTSIGDLLKTEDYSFNLIFEDPADDYYFEFLYGKLPYVLLFVVQVCLEAFHRVSELNEQTVSHLMITSLGAYESLFLDGRSQSVTRNMKQGLKEFLICVHCREPLKIGKKNAAEWYIMETVRCAECGLVNQMPLHWLCAFAEVTVTREQMKSDIDLSK